jgi:hypothetical protein
MTLEVEGEAPVTLKPGDSRHVPLKLLGFHVAEQGQPLSTGPQLLPERIHEASDGEAQLWREAFENLGIGHRCAISAPINK